jgi:hypothetical protein
VTGDSASSEVEVQEVAAGKLPVRACSDNASRSQPRRASVVAPLLGGNPQMATKLFGSEESRPEEGSQEEAEECGEEDENPASGGMLILEGHGGVIQITDSQQISTNAAVDVSSGSGPTFVPGVQDTKESTWSQASGTQNDPLHSFETLAAQFTDIDGQLVRQLDGASSSSSSSSSSDDDIDDQEKRQVVQQAGDASLETFPVSRSVLPPTRAAQSTTHAAVDNAELWNLLIGPASTSSFRTGTLGPEPEGPLTARSAQALRDLSGEGIFPGAHITP